MDSGKLESEYVSLHKSAETSETRALKREERGFAQEIPGRVLRAEAGTARWLLLCGQRPCGITVELRGKKPEELSSEPHISPGST